VIRARAGGIARAALPILLLCFHFDSSTGRYTLAVTKILRLMGLLTVALIATLVLVLTLTNRPGHASIRGPRT
jgi:protein SCO1/2